MAQIQSGTAFASRENSASREHLRAESCSPIRVRIMHETVDRIGQITEKVGVCMLTTRFGRGLRARPLEARPDRSHDRLLFVQTSTALSMMRSTGGPRWAWCSLITPTKLISRSRAGRRSSMIRSCARPLGVRTMPYGGRTQRSQRVCSRRRTSTAEIWDGPSSAALVAQNLPWQGDGTESWRKSRDDGRYERLKSEGVSP